MQAVRVADVATDPIWDAAGDLAVGAGADTAAGLAKGSALQVLRVNAAGTALEWAAASSGGSSSLLLDYVAATDLLNAAAVATGASWTDCGTNQSFTVGSGGGLVGISVRGGISSSGAGHVTARIVLDSAGTPITIAQLGDAPGPANVLGGADMLWVSGLSAGAHTVKVQLNASTTGLTAYCRASSFPQESLAIQVIQLGS